MEMYKGFCHLQTSLKNAISKITGKTSKGVNVAVFSSASGVTVKF